MPVPLARFIAEQGAEAMGTDHSQADRRRLDKMIDLFRPQRCQVQRLSAPQDATRPVANVLTAVARTSTDKAEKDKDGKQKQRTRKAKKQASGPASSSKDELYPRTVWLSTEDGTRTDGFLEDRAAVYLPDQHLLQINRDFWVFNDMIDYCCKDLADYPGAKELAAATVRLWYEQALVETVIGVRALTNRKEWSNRDIDSALSAEALTAAAMQRYHVAGAAKEDLQRKLRALPRTKAASDKTAKTAPPSPLPVTVGSCGCPSTSA